MAVEEERKASSARLQQMREQLDGEMAKERLLPSAMKAIGQP